MTRELSSASSLLGRAVALAIIASGFTTTAVAQSSETSVEFNMPAQSLDQALRNYGVVADKQVMFSVDLVNGKTVGPIAGEMTADEALQTLLADTGLTFETTTSDVILIRTAQWDSSVTGRNSLQTVRFQDVAPRQIESVDEKDDDGGFVVSEDEGDVFQQLEEIVVTGTNIRGVENPTTPVLQFDQEDIQFSGAATVEEFLRTIPQNFNSVSAVNVEGGDDFSSEDNPFRGTSINLRGLGGGTTLTLINGRRMTASGFGNFVDVSILPLGAIDRVEVLTDGASAIYGSDAVAGVVNFITRKDYEGLELRGRYGTVTDGSKEDYSLGAAGGTSWESGGALFGVEYTNATPLLARELPNVDLSDPDFTNSQGTIGGEEERISGTVSFNQGITDRISFAVDQLLSHSERTVMTNASVIPPREIRFEQDSFFINTRLDFEVTENTSFSLFYDYSQEDGASFDELDDFEEERFENTLQVVEGLYSGNILTLPSGSDFSFALGALYRDESFITNLFDFTGPVERNVTSIYGELLLPLIGQENALPFLQAFDISLAGRYEDFSDFGDTFNPKVGLHLGVSEELSLRASYSESFRAPTLFEVFGPSFVIVFARSNLDFEAFPEILADPDGVTTYISTAGSNPDLGPESADVWSASFDYEPKVIPGLSFATTYFKYDYSDRVESTNFFELLRLPEFNVLAIRNPDVGTVESFFARGDVPTNSVFNLVGAAPEDIEIILPAGLNNVAGRTVEGLDFVIEYQTDLANGTLSTSLNATHLLKFDTQLSESSPIIGQLNTLYRPIDFKMRSNVSWTRDGFTAFAAVNHTTGYEGSADSFITNEIDAFTTFDLAFSYDTSQVLSNSLLGGTMISLNIRNVLDEEPPFVETIDGFNFDTANADPFGRQISMSLRKSF